MDLTDGLTIWLPLEDYSLRDLSGNDYTGFALSSVAFSEHHPKDMGETFQFTNTAGIQSQLELPELTPPFTLSWWLLPFNGYASTREPSEAVDRIIVSWRETADESLPEIRYSIDEGLNISGLLAGKTRGGYHLTEHAGNLAPSTGFDYDEWHHCVVLVSDEENPSFPGYNDVTVIIDGEEIDQVLLISSAFSTGDGIMYVGDRALGDEEDAKCLGNICHFRRYERVISGEEIAALRNWAYAETAALIPVLNDEDALHTPQGPAATSCGVDSFPVLTSVAMALSPGLIDTDLSGVPAGFPLHNKPPVCTGVDRIFVPQGRWVIPPSEMPFIRLVFRLTVSLEGFDDIVLPMVSFQCRRRNGAPTYLACTITDPETWEADILARSYGRITIQAGEVLRDGTTNWAELLESAVDSYRYEVTTAASYGTLVGYHTETFNDSHTEALSGVSIFSKTEQGKRTVRSAVNFRLRPSYIATWGDGESMVVGQITYNVTSKNAYMTVQEE